MGWTGIWQKFFVRWQKNGEIERKLPLADDGVHEQGTEKDG